MSEKPTADDATRVSAQWALTLLASTRHLMTPDQIKSVRELFDLTDTPEPETNPETPTLSAKKRRILALVANGHSTDEIADRIGVANSTIRTHIKHIGRQLGTGRRERMVAIAIRAGIID